VTRRFVVHEHTVAPGDVHFDLMIEDGDVLVTFQLDGAPAIGARGRRSFDHRVRYLDYEGELTQDRGSVEIWDRGELVDVRGEPRANRYRVRFSGERLVGLYELTCGEAGVTLSRVAE
jgi:hypothetical protein